MDNKTLYIIGNGFDLHHGLQTSYADFCKYVKENDTELYDFLEGYFNLELDKDGLWSNFEENLNTFYNWQFLSDNDSTDPIRDEKFQLSDMYGVADDVREQLQGKIEQLRENFYNWLDEIDYSNLEYKPLPLDINAKYLTFNYTNTLQRLYLIADKNILHIHNSIATYRYNLVFGHGIKIEQEPQVDSEGNGSYPSQAYYEAEEASKMLLYHFYKDTKKIISKNLDFFDNLCDIDKIIVMGHSINKIDMPYFKQLNTKIKHAKWTVSYYKKEDIKRMNCRLLKIDIKDISFIKLNDIKA
jgi:hypothetical protein